VKKSKPKASETPRKKRKETGRMLVFGRVRPLGFGAESTVFPAAIKIKNDPGEGT
jgi:hypothetical protein